MFYLVFSQRKLKVKKEFKSLWSHYYLLIIDVSYNEFYFKKNGYREGEVLYLLKKESRILNFN